MVSDSTKLVAILPGGSSPYSSHGRPLYDWLRAGFARRDINAWLLDYVGMGHYPGVRQGLDVTKIAQIVSQRLSLVTEPYVLLSSCLGTLVVSKLWAYFPESLHNCQKMVLWATPSSDYLNNLAKQFPVLARFNEEVANPRGFGLCDDFWGQTETLLDLAGRVLLPLHTCLMCGDNDEQSNEAYLHTCRKSMSSKVAALTKVMVFEAGHSANSVQAPENFFAKILE